MSEKFANFALSQESDNISNFFGSVSQKLEMENVGNFLLTQAVAERLPMPYMRGLLSCILFVNWFPTTIYQENAISVHASCINPVGLGCPTIY